MWFKVPLVWQWNGIRWIAETLAFRYGIQERSNGEVWLYIAYTGQGVRKFNSFEAARQAAEAFNQRGHPPTEPKQ